MGNYPFKRMKQVPTPTSFAMAQEPNGNHGVQITDIYALVDSTVNNKFSMVASNKNAADVLYLSKGISIPNNIFKQVKLGNDVNVLVYDGYLGKDNIDYVYDFAIVDNRPTFYLFSDPLTNDKAPRAVKVERIHRLFTALVNFFVKPEYITLRYSIYYNICYYAPMVLTVRLIENINNRQFSLDKDFDAEMYLPSIQEWFNQDALDIIHSMTDRQLFEFGGLIEHIENNCQYDY